MRNPTETIPFIILLARQRRRNGRLGVSELIVSLPHGLQDLDISIGRHVCCDDFGLHVNVGCFNRLGQLRRLSLNNLVLSDWSVLRPVAPQLRYFSYGHPDWVSSAGLREARASSSVTAGAVLSMMDGVRELSIAHDPGVDEAVVVESAFKLRRLRRLSFMCCDIKDAVMARAVLGAACSASLRVLSLGRNCWYGSGDEPEFCLGDETAVAVGRMLCHLDELYLYGKGFSSVGVAAIEHGCLRLAGNATRRFEVGRGFIRGYWVG